MKRQKKFARSWICRSHSEHKEDLVLCYSHSRHFLVRDDYRRVRRAPHSACHHCAEAVIHAQHPEDAVEMLNGERRRAEKTILEVASDDSLQLMRIAAERRAKELEREAAQWRLVGKSAVNRVHLTKDDLRRVGDDQERRGGEAPETEALETK